MSQYPPPTGPTGPYPAPNPPAGYPQYGAPAYYAPDPMHAARAPARRAAVALCIIGLIMASCTGLCLLGTIGGLIEEGMQQQPNAAATLKQAGLSVNGFKWIVGIFSGVVCLSGLFLTVMSWFVWRGNLAATVISLVSTILLGLCFLLCAGIETVDGELGGALFMGLLPCLIFVIVSTMLVLGIKGINRSKGVFAQMQMQAWQYQQQYYNPAIGSGYHEQQQPPPQQPPPANQ